MNPLDIARGRLTDLRAELDSLKTKRSAVVDLAIAEKRDMTDAEREGYNADSVRAEGLRSEISVVTERITELEADETRKAAEAEARAKVGGAKVTEAPIYRQDNTGSESYFRDLYKATRRNDPESAERLRRNAAIETEKRAAQTTGDMVGPANAPGSGNAGVFAPPSWLVDQFVKLARPGRVGVDTFAKAPLPTGVSSINIPKVTTGTITGLQAGGELQVLPEQDIATTSLSSGITTVGGKQVISLQLLEQSAIPFDQVILEDLALSYAASIDLQGLTGSGAAGNLRGLGSAAGLDIASATIDATQKMSFSGGALVPAGASTSTNFYNAILQAQAKIHSVRFLSPDTILMHPSRWSWVVAQADNAGRPLVLPTTASAYNAYSEDATVQPQGRVGTLAGMDVFVDPQIPVNVNSGDVIYVYLRQDIKLWESAPRAEAFDATYADQAGVLFRMLGYAAMIPDRYGSSIVQIRNVGTPAAGKGLDGFAF
jgi:HK97 family phage major capsid protein